MTNTSAHIEIERRWLIMPNRDYVECLKVLEQRPHTRWDTHSISQRYIRTREEGAIERIRLITPERGSRPTASFDHPTMIHTKKTRVEVDGVVGMREEETVLSHAAYIALGRLSLPDREPVVKSRTSIVFASHPSLTFEIDIFQTMPLAILEIEFKSPAEALGFNAAELPPELQVYEEITGNNAYSNFNLSRRGVHAYERNMLVSVLHAEAWRLGVVVSPPSLFPDVQLVADETLQPDPSHVMPLIRK